MGVLDKQTTTQETQNTSLPTWFTNAQQNVITGTQNVQSPTDTTLSNAVNTFGNQGAFQQGQNALGSIAAGANPWMTDASGQTVANPNTAFGGLYNAGIQQLNATLPQVTAQSNANSIAAGGFGSLRNQTATNMARNVALSNFNKDMANALLQNQQSVVSAGAGLGNLGNQQVQSALNTSAAQENQPFASLVNQANILKGVGGSQVDTGIKKTATPSTMNQLIGLGSATQGGLNALLGGTKTSANGVSTTTPGMLSQINQLFSGGGGGGSTGGTGPTPGDFGYDPNAADNYQGIDLNDGSGNADGSGSVPDWWWTESFE